MALGIVVQDHVATLTLNRPEAMNSIDPEMREQLHAAWKRIKEDDDIRVVILTGAGEKAFCTGSDLKKTMPPKESFAELTFGRATSDHLLAGLDTDKPLICAVNGYAMGGGMELALACDIRVASDNAVFALSEVRIGSIPGAGGTQRLPRAIGSSNAMLMLLTGDRVDAAEALRIGLVSKVVSREELLPAAQEIARRIAQNAPLSVRSIKRLVVSGADMPLPAALDNERYVFGLLRDTEDRIEGRRAFQEKRSPVYQGR
ncbi:enoyl-CoA hydratase/isomerase family protein [Achromobacter aegrifaciens]|uniref:enoyl-CoA hydratase/isomerase family protein n=1 Tax=Achromobacter aegrifaciens TaxID=1287736 RepID=UPI000D4762C7|nr:enoyl-CoA hydratase-related protein [Achromobacter aegrifaciens]MDQ1763094.1 enoyl-CoA hydratase-related protein [Achromobacter aegrifaciens]PTN50153.1 enoyl-CoA hydratase [Achromobacter xylosoxidans]